MITLIIGAGIDAACTREKQRATHLLKDDANTGPLVLFARSGAAAHWNASAYESILELAEACDVPVRKEGPIVRWGTEPGGAE